MEKVADTLSQTEEVILALNKMPIERRERVQKLILAYGSVDTIPPSGSTETLTTNRHLARAGKVLSSLTQRQADIVNFSINGMSNKETAIQLGISYRTVEAHRRAVLKKLNLKNFVEVAHLAGALQFANDSK